MLSRRSLFAVTGFTLTIAVSISLLISVSAITLYVLIPVSRQAADDLAALIVLSAQTWVELPPQTRADFETELRNRHDLHIKLAEIDQQPASVPDRALYLSFLEAALLQRTGQQVAIRASDEGAGGEWLNIELSLGSRQLQISFHSARLGTHIPTAIVWMVAAGTAVVLVSSLLLVRRVTRPLSRMAAATSRIGGGKPAAPLPESGPSELAALARSFNRMEHQVRDLLENRTTILAGISHDLRTPISRMRLALEMLPQDNDPELMCQLRQDLTEMEQLIAQALELARGLGDSEPKQLDIRESIGALVVRYQQVGAKLDWQPGGRCMVQVVPLALQRVLTNLVDNAVSFSGQDDVVRIDCSCGHRSVSVWIRDRGPGISAEHAELVFRPFYRVEASRNRSTGGSGLGLAITRQLCEVHGWEVELTPRAGGGTDAHLRIPRLPEQIRPGSS